MEQTDAYFLRLSSHKFVTFFTKENEISRYQYGQNFLCEREAMQHNFATPGICYTKSGFSCRMLQLKLEHARN